MWNFIKGLVSNEPNEYKKRLMRMDEKTQADWIDGQNEISQDQIMNEDYSFLEVHGAGKIKISKSPVCSTGRVFGFSFDVSWGRFGYCGGVLSHEDARKMALMILEACDNISDEQKQKHELQLIEQDKAVAYFNNL